MNTELMRANALAGAVLRLPDAKPPRFWTVTLHRAEQMPQHHGCEAVAIRAAIEAMQADPTVARFSVEGQR